MSRRLSRKEPFDLESRSDPSPPNAPPKALPEEPEDVPNRSGPTGDPFDEQLGAKLIFAAVCFLLIILVRVLGL